MSEEITIYSPYKRLQNFWGEDWVVDIPQKIRDYLLLLPTKECPNPILGNENPRARFVKYLYYDDPNPLSYAVPSVKDRLDIIFDPYKPDNPPNKEKGYRIFTQSNTAQANVRGNTILRIVMGKGLANDPFSITYGIHFQILSNYSLEASTRTTVLSRTFAIEEAIIEALNGVNMDGVGTFMIDRRSHTDNGSKPISDDQEFLGRLLTMSIETKVTGSGVEISNY